MVCLLLRVATIFFVLAPVAVSAQGATLIQVENSKPGDPSWFLSNTAKNREIEGYGSAVSINRGESITFFVNTAAPIYTLEVFRMGWYAGAGARKMLPAVTLSGTQQPIPTADPITGLIECHWAPSYVLQVPNNPADPTDWMSGIYLVKLTALDSGKQSYILFVVRDDARRSDFIFQNSVATYEAYNSWGGMSLYTKPRAFKVSFNRPTVHGAGAGDFISWGWENHMLRFLEREGYDVTYTTDVDTHARGDLLLLHKGLLVVGHDEYWSWQMRDNVEQARDSGVSLGFFGSNIGYWQVRFEPSTVDSAPNRTMTCYKSANLDPITQTLNPDTLRLATTKFRLPPVNRPEDALIGVMYETGNIGGDLVVANASAWVLQGTGLQNGDHLAHLLGYEADRIFDHAPRGLEQVAHSPYAANGLGGCSGTDTVCETRFSDMTDYEAESGATVVATGSMHWNWGLDNLPPNPLPKANSAVQQAMRNILSRFLHPLSVYLQPRVVVFPTQLKGTASSQDIVIVNHQSVPLSIHQSNDGGDFQYENGCPEILPPGQRCVVNASYHPTSVGVTKGNAQFILDGGFNGPVNVPLTGTGMDFALVPAAGAPVSETIGPKDHARYSLNLTSQGFAGKVKLSCKPQSTDLGCSVVPSEVTITTQSIDVHVDAAFLAEHGLRSRNAPPAVLPAPASLHSAWLIVLLLLAFAAGFPRIRPVILAIAIAMCCIGCGRTDSSPASTQSGSATGTLATYHLTVDAASQDGTRSIDLQLNVRSGD